MIIALVALAIYMVVRAAVAAYREKTAKWQVHEEETADSTEIWLVKGQTADFIGRAMRNSDDYDVKYLEIRSEAEEQMYNRNAASRVAKRLN